MISEPQFTQAERDDQNKIIDAIVLTLSDPMKAQKEFPSALSLARKLTPEDPENVRVFNAVRGGRLAHLTLVEFKTAMNKVRSEYGKAQKEMYKEELAHRRKAGIVAVLGGMPEDERQAVDLFMASHHYDMEYDRKFVQRVGNTLVPSKFNDVRNDLHLTMAALKLVKPRGDLLGATNLDRAIDEWQNNRRSERLELVCDRVNHIPKDFDRDGVNAQFDAICQAYFIPSAFGAACVRNHIWQTKHKMLRLPIEQHRMLVLTGPQNSGKSWFGRNLMGPVLELAAEASLRDVLDERQMDMPQFYVLFLDEMMAADRADMATMKNLISGAVSARRPMGTNTAAKIPINATLQGNSNKTLGSLIFDASGMRRFCEVPVKSRVEIEPNWYLLESFNWLDLWRSVDPYGADPLLPFEKELRQSQEKMRNPGNCEQWLDAFEFNRNLHTCKHDTSSNERVEFFAADLYQIFRDWEDIYSPDYKTSLNRWGRDFKSLIEQNLVPDWSHRMAGNKTVYSKKVKLVQPSTELRIVR